jgi:ankyrin repeat protein
MMKRTLRIGLLVLVLLNLVSACDQRKSFNRGLHTALAIGDTNYLHRNLVASNAVNQTLQYGPSDKFYAPLINIAIEHGQVETVKYLLRCGANPNQCDSLGKTPLAWACGRVRSEVRDEAVLQMVLALLSAGADPNLKDATGYTPLIWASSFGQKQIVDSLLKAGARVVETNNVGHTALHLAKDAEIARLLLAAGARLDIRTKYGDTPLDSAVEGKRFDVLAVLTNSVTQTNRVNAESTPP